MTHPTNDTYRDYVRYAMHCLDMMTITKNQDDRAIQREMAAEWAKLADALLHPLK